MTQDRREFLKNCGLGMTMSALAGSSSFGLMSALAQNRGKRAELTAPSDYRALVCVFLYGGNDANNMIIPLHNDANVSGYSAYAAARSTQGLALAQNTLLPIQVPRVGNLSYGLHPAFGTVTGGINPGLHPLWATGKMAAVTNVGTLVEPINRGRWIDRSGRRPLSLFSHSDQTNQHMTARADAAMLSGWGGRIADRMTFTDNPARLVPTVTAVNGLPVYTVGDSLQALAITPAPASLSSILTLTGYNNTPVSNARLEALNAAVGHDGGQELIAAANLAQRQGIEIGRALTSTADTTVAFPNTDIGNQLKQVARMIKSRALLGMNRQIFFVAQGGYDTHTGQISGHNVLFSRLSQAMRAFYDEMTAQSLGDKVIQFTMSDFSRTFNPGGSGTNVGSDHGWASHQLVVGDAVLGGDFFGGLTSNGTPFPTLVNNGPDDSDVGTNARGRWIPTTSVEQYGATLANWFGLQTADLPYVFPNIGNFSNLNLGFIQP